MCHERDSRQGDGHRWMQRSLAFVFEAGFKDKGHRLRFGFRKISLAEYRYQGAILEAGVSMEGLNQGRWGRRRRS